jgi:hypothetical protein
LIPRGSIAASFLATGVLRSLLRECPAGRLIARSDAERQLVDNGGALQSGANPTLMPAVPCDEPPGHQESYSKCISLDLLHRIFWAGDERRPHQHALIIKAWLVPELLMTKFVRCGEALNTEWALCCNEHPWHWVVQETS